MKKVTFFLAVAGACLLASCAKTIEQPAAEESVAASKVVTYIQANGNEDAAKASIDNSAAFTWSKGDKIAVFVGEEYLFSEGLDSGGSADANFAFTSGIDQDERANFALYPASLACDTFGDPRTDPDDCKASNLLITLPGSYNLSDIKGEAAPVFMIAENAPNTALAFKQLGALLRFKLQYIPKDATYLTFDFEGKKVQGEFTLKDVVAGTTAITTAATTDDDDIITVVNDVFTVFQDAVILNIPVPTGEYSYVTITAYDSSDHKINSIKTSIAVDGESAPVSWTAIRKSAHKRIAKLPYFTTNETTKKKVVFAPGNLQGKIKTRATGDSNQIGSFYDDAWKFAEHQYDALGDCKGNTLAANNELIDLFCWVGESATYDYASNPEQKYGLIWPHNSLDYGIYVGNSHPENVKYSWAEIFNGVSYPENTWRLPNGTKEGGENSTEWQRLTSGRNKTYVCTKATIKDGDDLVAYGIIIFPDTYEHPYGFKEIQKCGKNKQTGATVHYADNIITLTEWNQLETECGCVFLPVTNTRSRNSGSKTLYYSDAAYWACYSGSANSGIALLACDADVCASSVIGSSKTDLLGAKSVLRRNGCAVRLIRDVN